MQVNADNINKARVNITLEVATGKAQQKKELPLKLLLLGDYSGGTNPLPLGKRQRHVINQTNFDAVLKRLGSQLNINVENKLPNQDANMNVKLRFQSQRDFEPLQIAAQVPALKRLLAMRTVLKDLKANMMDNVALKHALNQIFGQQASRVQLQHELSALLPSEKEIKA